MDICIYGMKPLKANTLQSLPERFRLEHYCLGNIFVTFSRFTHHYGRHDGSIQERICPCGPCSPHIRKLFFLRMMASTSRTMRSAIQLQVYVRDSKSTRMRLPFSLRQQTHLT
ncbi:hypothetical protein TNCV_4800971 [Trichonephila clavipes]|nr:hypothetical protein TNCV_4800971 [Trichonephila clavipes]